MLKVGLSKLSDSPGTSAVSSVDKLGVAAATPAPASDQDLLHKQQVGEISAMSLANHGVSLSGRGLRVEVDPGADKAEAAAGDRPREAGGGEAGPEPR